MIKILPIEECPAWLQYPSLYLNLIKQGQEQFLHWCFIENTKIVVINKDLQKKYARNLFIFAVKDNCDDIACWEKNQGDRIFIIDDSIPRGFEQIRIFDDFDSWYQWALQDIDPLYQIRINKDGRQDNKTETEEQVIYKFSINVPIIQEGEIYGFEARDGIIKLKKKTSFELQDYCDDFEVLEEIQLPANTKYPDNNKIYLQVLNAILSASKNDGCFVDHAEHKEYA